jgi:hypothetical protein
MSHGPPHTLVLYEYSLIQSLTHVSNCTYIYLPALQLPARRLACLNGFNSHRPAPVLLCCLRLPRARAPAPVILAPCYNSTVCCNTCYLPPAHVMLACLPWPPLWSRRSECKVNEFLTTAPLLGRFTVPCVYCKKSERARVIFLAQPCRWLSPAVLPPAPKRRQRQAAAVGRGLNCEFAGPQEICTLPNAFYSPLLLRNTIVQQHYLDPVPPPCHRQWPAAPRQRGVAWGAFSRQNAPAE